MNFNGAWLKRDVASFTCKKFTVARSRFPGGSQQKECAKTVAAVEDPSLEERKEVLLPPFCPIHRFWFGKTTTVARPQIISPSLRALPSLRARDHPSPYNPATVRPISFRNSHKNLSRWNGALRQGAQHPAGVGGECGDRELPPCRGSHARTHASRFVTLPRAT